MASPDWDLVSRQIQSILDTLPSVKRTYGHEPLKVPNTSYPFATLWGPARITRPGAQVRQTQFGVWDSTATWTIRIYLRFQGPRPSFAQSAFRDHSRDLINAFDTYRNGTPASQPWADDAAIIEILPAILDRDREVFVVEATLESFHTA
jgi:hypothetical protein